MRRLSTPLEEKYIAKMAPTVSTPPRAVVSTSRISPVIWLETARGHASMMMRATSAARFSEPMKPAIAVTRIRNGNIDISTDSAMWLAIAQPSSALKR